MRQLEIWALTGYFILKILHIRVLLKNNHNTIIFFLKFSNTIRKLRLQVVIYLYILQWTINATELWEMINLPFPGIPFLKKKKTHWGTLKNIVTLSAATQFPYLKHGKLIQNDWGDNDQQPPSSNSPASYVNTPGNNHSWHYPGSYILVTTNYC